MLTQILILIFQAYSLQKSVEFPAPYPDKGYPAKDYPMDIERQKCKTCCKVLFASEYNIDHKRQFTDQDDADGHRRFIMNMEFDQLDNVREATGNYEQAVLMRPIEHNPDLAYFELYQYKMINSYLIPKRVLDIKGGSKVGSNLIIWSRKNPLLATSDNQRFTYVYQYPDYQNNYKKHFMLPYASTALCFEVLTDKFNIWNGNSGLQYSSDVYQIVAGNCDSNNPKQIFTPIFA